jgi:hypothetical protein
VHNIENRIEIFDNDGGGDAKHIDWYKYNFDFKDEDVGGAE